MYRVLGTKFERAVRLPILQVWLPLVCHLRPAVVWPSVPLAGPVYDSAASGEIRLLMARFFWTCCSSSGDADTQLLIESEGPPQEGFPPLVVAADEKNTAEVARLLKQKANVNARSEEGEAALHKAAYWGQTDMVKLLIDARADPKIQDLKGKTALRRAYDNPEIVEILLQAGADVNEVDKQGRTTLHRSAENGHVDVIKVLLPAKANPNLRNSEQMTPLHEAANFGQVEALKMLIDAGGNVNAQDEFNHTPLHFAAYAGNKEVAELLVRAKADINVKNKEGETALMCASDGNKSPEVAALLRTL